MSRGSDAEIEPRDRIRTAMRLRGRNIRALSKRTGIPYASLRAALSGKHNLRADTLARIAHDLEVSADWLLSGNPLVVDHECLTEALATLGQMKQTLTEHRWTPENELTMLGNLYRSAFAKKYHQLSLYDEMSDD